MKNNKIDVDLALIRIKDLHTLYVLRDNAILEILT